MAKRRKGRDIDGVILLDKPLEISSNQALQKVRGIFKASKAGHTGALDPLATGMLPICLGEATKFSQFLLDSDKTYLTTATFGIRTSTCDADGEVVDQQPINFGMDELLAVLEQFRGPIKQVPSMFSALKHQGKPLYYYARQGIEIEREARDIEIFALNLLSFDGTNAELEVHCSKGTYIRSLVDDIGQALGCCAYVSKLHRTKVADYPVDKVVDFDTLQALREAINANGEQDWSVLDSWLLPMDSAVSRLPAVQVSDEDAARLQHGQPVANPDAGVQGATRIYVQSTEQFIGVGEAGDKLAPKRLVVTAQN